MIINIEACRPALTRHKNSEKYKEKHDDKHSCKQTGTHKTYPNGQLFKNVFETSFSKCTQ